MRESFDTTAGCQLGACMSKMCHVRVAGKWHRSHVLPRRWFTVYWDEIRTEWQFHVRAESPEKEPALRRHWDRYNFVELIDTRDLCPRYDSSSFFFFFSFLFFLHACSPGITRFVLSFVAGMLIDIETIGQVTWSPLKLKWNQREREKLPEWG
jgi:hypothetical protein